MATIESIKLKIRTVERQLDALVSSPSYDEPQIDGPEANRHQSLTTEFYQLQAELGRAERGEATG